ncbi:hypothetical protein HPB52_025508 [Rhipicephalus sanguineus]|uniref:Uncharacterized protein n=1 Tax=Rhipicephalus sanguineus TaxID=34632 RepID=A0A9D4YRY2_RHISA|nr:hypothetical protein HPB52_025508 [Rhipicephalus sanguineus]
MANSEQLRKKRGALRAGVTRALTQLTDLLQQTDPDLSEVAYFVACMLSQDKPTEAGKPCAEKVGTDWGVLDRCSSGPEGTQLMYEMGKRTRDHMPRIEYVPWIEVNGAHNLTIQEKAQGQLFDFTCELLEPEAPKVCQKPGSYYCAA